MSSFYNYSNMKKNIYVFIFLAVVLSPVFMANTGDKNKDDLVAINTSYLKHPNITMRVDYFFYNSSKDINPSEQYRGLIKKKAKWFYSNIMGIEQLINEKDDITIDHKNKILVIGKASSFNVGPELFPNMDSLAKICKQIKKVTYQSNPGYRFIFDGEKHYAYSFFFDAKSYLLKRLEIQFSKQKDGKSPLLVINYSDININPVFNSKDFSSEKYFTREKNKIVLVPQLKSYRVLK